MKHIRFAIKVFFLALKHTKQSNGWSTKASSEKEKKHKNAWYSLILHRISVRQHTKSNGIHYEFYGKKKMECKQKMAKRKNQQRNKKNY